MTALKNKDNLKNIDVYLHAGIQAHALIKLYLNNMHWDQKNKIESSTYAF